MTHFVPGRIANARLDDLESFVEGIAMSKAAEFAIILKMNPMFSDLGSDELQRISGLCHTQHLGLGEMLFQKGDPGDALYGVRRGQIRIETGASDGSTNSAGRSRPSTSSTPPAGIDSRMNSPVVRSAARPRPEPLSLLSR